MRDISELHVPVTTETKTTIIYINKNLNKDDIINNIKYLMSRLILLYKIWVRIRVIWYLTPLSKIFQLYCGSQFYSFVFISVLKLIIKINHNIMD
jgi:hypothetical protein